MTPRGHCVRDLAGQAPPWACGAAGGPSSHGPVIQDWEHHELRRSRRDLSHLSHEVALREAHAARQTGHDGWPAGHDFRAVALLADAVEAYAATSRTGSRPPDAAPIPDDGVNH